VLLATPGCLVKDDLACFSHLAGVASYSPPGKARNQLASSKFFAQVRAGSANGEFLAGERIGKRC
jgi:hypothetical protein